MQFTLYLIIKLELHFIIYYANSLNLVNKSTSAKPKKWDKIMNSSSTVRVSFFSVWPTSHDAIVYSMHTRTRENNGALCLWHGLWHLYRVFRREPNRWWRQNDLVYTNSWKWTHNVHYCIIKLWLSLHHN